MMRWMGIDLLNLSVPNGSGMVEGLSFQVMTVGVGAATMNRLRSVQLWEKHLLVSSLGESGTAEPVWWEHEG